MGTLISQRELRNDNADIMRRVEQGEEFTVTRNGRPIARVIPLDDIPPQTRRLTGEQIAAEWVAMGPFDASGWARDIRDARADLDEDPSGDAWAPRP